MDMSQHATLEAAKNKEADAAQKLETGAFVGLAVLIAGWLAAGAIFGANGITIPALILVPVAYVFLFLLTKG